jgi:hypothetical protein
MLSITAPESMLIREKVSEMEKIMVDIVMRGSQGQSKLVLVLYCSVFVWIGFLSE